MIPPGVKRTVQARWFQRKDCLGVTTDKGFIFLPVAVVKWSTLKENQITIITTDTRQHTFEFTEYVTYQTSPRSS